eukprot:scaffold366018_cov37-Attheya_sp.AAC.1
MVYHGYGAQLEDMCFDLDIQSAEGGGLGNGGRPDAVGGAGAMAGFAVLGRWFHRRKGVERNTKYVWGPPLPPPCTYAVLKSKDGHRVYIPVQ